MKNQAESKLQAECFVWHWNSFPDYRRLMYANHNNSANAIQGAQNKAMGVVAGVADISYCFANRIHYIEFKTDSGYVSKEQQEFRDRVEKQGALYYIVRSFEQFESLINHIHTEIEILA
ncbi:MAG: hypothetical protein ACRCVT_10080 [Leadbetterella sp.]